MGRHALVAGCPVPAGRRAHRWRTRLGLAVAVTALAVGLPLALPGPGWAGDGWPHRAPTPTPSSQPVKYYVVGAPVGGQREYLYQIAAKTLGNGNRYQEIFALNRDRLQPDGGRLTDPMVLEPSWILLLPPDASGPGVHTGPLPVVSAVPAASAGAVPAARAGSRPGSAPAAPAASAPAIPAAANRADSAGADALQIGAIGVAVSAVVGWVVLGAGRRRRAAGAQPVDALPAGRPAAPLPAGRSVAPALGGAPPRVGPPPPVSGPPPPPVSGPPPAGGDPDGSDGPAADAAPTELSTQLNGYGPAVTVSLLGCRGRGPGYTWRDRGTAPPVGEMAVPLGEQDGRTLWVDLALAPDVVTVLGPLPDSQRYGREMAKRLVASGVEVAVLGDALGPGAPAGCRRVAALPEPGAPGGAWTGVLFCAEPPAPVRRAAARLRAAGTGQPVPVLLGAIPRACWSVQVGAPVSESGTTAADPPDQDRPAAAPVRRRDRSWRRKDVVFLKS